MEQEEKGQMFLLEHFLIVSSPQVNHSTIPLASHLYLTSALRSLQDENLKDFSFAAVNQGVLCCLGGHQALGNVHAEFS